jgi:cyclase
MRRVRVIPTLLIQKGGLVKSMKFKDHKYVGDPMNAVKIFNEKEVDEIVILDISASAENRKPDMKQIATIASEAFMPLAYGGGIKSIDEIKALVSAGVEKVIINNSAHTTPQLISEAAKYVGSQSVVISIDVAKNFLGKEKVFIEGGKKNTGIDPVVFARQMEQLGAGEILLNSIARDGTFSGYDLELIRKVSNEINIPVVAAGGAATIGDFLSAIKSGASAVSAGSMFVFQGPHRAVLISYPKQEDLKEKLFAHIG